MKLTGALLAFGFASASASADQMTLLAKIKAQLSSGGATNCQYKCANLFNINTLWDAANGNVALNAMDKDSVSVLNEYLGCNAGCQSCNGGGNAQCMAQCKDRNWFTTTWWYNPYSGGMAFDDDCEVEKKAQLEACLAKVPVPDTGGRAQLPDWYTTKTQNCYDNTTYGIVAINAECNQQCKEGATCTEYTRDTQECGEEKDVTKQYSADMCGAGVLKNIIEPDKACIIGCITNLCQTGAQCLGQGVWSEQTDHKYCQKITPQQNGQKYTIVPQIFEQQGSDLLTCCSQSRVCCSYGKAWAATDGGKRQRQGVCNVANRKAACGSGVPNFNLKAYGGDISKGKYPGNGCQRLWDDTEDPITLEPTGVCSGAGFDPCPSCLQ